MPEVESTPSLAGEIVGRYHPPAVKAKPMDRRAFVAGLGAILAAPLGVGAQQPGKLPDIGFLIGGAGEKLFFEGRVAEKEV